MSFKLKIGSAAFRRGRTGRAVLRRGRQSLNVSCLRSSQSLIVSGLWSQVSLPYTLPARKPSTFQNLGLFWAGGCGIIRAE